MPKKIRSLRVDRVYNGDDWSHRRPDRTRTARHLATAYNRLLTESTSEVVWFVEDDILLPAGAGHRMLQLLLDGETPKTAVSGLYKSRHEDCYVIGTVDGGHVLHTEDLPGEPGPWDLAGTGCLMVFRPMTNATFLPFWHVPGNGQPVPAHDWAFSWQLRQNQQPVWLHPEIRCRHFQTETQWV